MMMDSLADALTVIRNAEKVNKKECVIKPVSKLTQQVLTLIKDLGYVGEFEIVDNKRGRIAKVQLISKINSCGAIKPRFPVTIATMEKYEKRYLPAAGFGYLIISTSKGVLTHFEAKKKNVGGVLLAYVY